MANLTIDQLTYILRCCFDANGALTDGAVYDLVTAELATRFAK